MSPNGDEAPVSRVEYEARHRELLDVVAANSKANTDSIQSLSKVIAALADSQAATVKDTGELKGWLKGTGVALSIVTSILLAAAGLHLF